MRVHMRIVNDNSVEVVKHNAQLIHFTVVWQIFHFCLSHWTNISTLQTSSTYETLTPHTTFIYYHQHLMVRKSSWKKYKKEMHYASMLFKTAIALWLEWVVLYLCWHLFCQQKICICNKWVWLPVHYATLVQKVDCQNNLRCVESCRILGQSLHLTQHWMKSTSLQEFHHIADCYLQNVPQSLASHTNIQTASLIILHFKLIRQPCNCSTGCE